MSTTQEACAVDVAEAPSQVFGFAPVVYVHLVVKGHLG